MSTDNNLVMFDVTGLPTENVPRELVTCFRKVVDDGGTIHAEPYGEPAPIAPHLGLSNTKLAAVSFFHAITKSDICHQHNMTRSSVC